MVLVLSGRLEIFVGADRHALEPGDSICFPSTTPHRYLNPTGQTTRAVTLILPDGGTGGPPPTDRRT
jgi:quercetin dioxygenase-like cupin family protein